MIEWLLQIHIKKVKNYYIPNYVFYVCIVSLVDLVS